MPEPVHIAITRRVRPDARAEFERLLSEFAARSLADPGSRGVNLIYPTPGAAEAEYGILRSFADHAAKDAFYKSPLYLEWTLQVEPLLAGGTEYRSLEGLEAWFREPHQKLPPRWKMAVLTWIAVWPVSTAVPALFSRLYPAATPVWLRAGIGAAGIVIVLTWLAMPLLVRLAHPWLHPRSKPQES